MTDPGAAERLAALRSTRNAPKVPHARAARILTAGVSTSMVLGLVSYMAHSANVEAAAAARAAAREATTKQLADKIARSAPITPAPTVTVGVAPVGPPPGAAAPTPHVVVVPVPQPARPATQPATQQSKPATTSRSSK
jgi:hypothetical protein